MNRDLLRFRENHKVPVVVNLSVEQIDMLFDLSRQMNEKNQHVQDFVPPTVDELAADCITDFLNNHMPEI